MYQKTSNLQFKYNALIHKVFQNPTKSKYFNTLRLNFKFLPTSLHFYFQNGLLKSNYTTNLTLH